MLVCILVGYFIAVFHFTNHPAMIMHRTCEHPHVFLTKIMVVIFSKAGVEFTGVLYLCNNIAAVNHTSFAVFKHTIKVINFIIYFSLYSITL